MPRLTSLWYLVSLYSGDGLVGITTRIIWHGNPFKDGDACPHLPAPSESPTHQPRGARFMVAGDDQPEGSGSCQLETTDQKGAKETDWG